MQHLEAVIRARIPSIAAMINKTIDDIEAELNQIGRPLANDAGVSCSSGLGSFVSFDMSLEMTLGRFLEAFKCLTVFMLETVHWLVISFICHIILLAMD